MKTRCKTKSAQNAPRAYRTWSLRSRRLGQICAISVIFIVTSSLMLVGSVLAQSSVTVNTSNAIGTNSFSLGVALSTEWRHWLDTTALRQLVKDGNFELVRFCSRDMEPCNYWYESSKTGIFDWTGVDLLIQRIFEIGAQPVITLGQLEKGLQLPPGMAINPDTGLPYPASYAAYCREWVRHIKAAGFNVRFYEVFNEAWYYFYPDWSWNGVKAGYFLQLFNACYEAMHLENPQVLVANDATSRRMFLDYWIAYGGKMDWISFHNYDCDGPNMEDALPLQRAETRYYVTDGLFYGVNDIRQLWRNARGVNLQYAIATEANFAATSFGGDPRIQKVVGAVWTALNLRSNIVYNVQYSCYFSCSSSKSWELEHGTTGGYGMGMINEDDNQPWYPYYVQKLVGTNLAVGDTIVASSSSSSDIRPLAWIHEGKLNLLLICKVDVAQDARLYGLQGTLNYFKIDNTVSYQTPRVQTGIIDSSSLLHFNGYTVILLQSTSASPSPSPTTSPISTILSEGFESGGFGAWSGIITKSNDVVSVVNSAYQGTRCAKFTTNGDGGFEGAYSYKNTASSTWLDANSFSYVSQSGITNEDNRFYLMILRAENNNVAYAGWRKIDGVARWNLIIRDGTGYALAYSTVSPQLNQWYDLTLHWSQDTTDGHGRLYVNGVLVCSISGKNTAAYGAVTNVRFGLSEVVNCGPTAVYLDNCSIIQGS